MNRQDTKHAKNVKDVAAKWRDTSAFDRTSFLSQLGVFGVLAVQFSVGNTQLLQYHEPGSLGLLGIVRK